MWNELYPTIAQAADPLIKLLITLAVAWLTATIKRRLDAGTARDITLELTALAEIVVRHLEQVMRPELGNALADGKLETSEARHLRNVALAGIKDQSSKALAKAIERNAARGVVAIEAAVQKMNAEKAAGTS